MKVDKYKNLATALDVLAIAFIYAKIMEQIDWSWWFQDSLRV